MRAGSFAGKARTQTQIAISADAASWFLLGASPDLRLQIETAPELHPAAGSRNSPIAGVLLPSADLDQITGLLSLRELQPFRVYCTSSVRRILRDQNTVFGMLNRVPNQVEWCEFKVGDSFSLSTNEHAIRCEAVSLGTRFPAYVMKPDTLLAQEATVGFVMTSPNGKRMAFLPAVPSIDGRLLELLSTVDVLLFDGTFWSEDELVRVQGAGATASEMGHVTVSGEEGSLRKLARLQRPRKIFVHVNNTNPMLDESSDEYRQVRDAGWEIAEDGWRLDL